MKWLGKLLGKKKKYSNNAEFKLCIVNENSDLVSEVLGITEERCRDIGKTVMTSFSKHEKKTESIQEILNECKHINEVVFAFECYNKIVELKEREFKLHSFVQKLFGDE